MSDDVSKLFDPSYHPRILVVGDLILDRYLWGVVNRISPEAPIPLMRVVKQEHRLGGAGSVASMLAALEASVALASVTGADPDGRTVRELLEGIGVDTAGVLDAADRPTTVKQRYLGLAQSRHPQQMIRVDFEDDRPLSVEGAEELIALIEAQIDRAQMVLVSDYNKGVCANELVPRVVTLAKRHHVPVVADPVLGADYNRYAGCACITPNRLEAGTALGITIRSPEEGLRAAEKLLEFGVEGAIVTLDRDGMAWANRAGERGLFPVRERQVYDITGAGDMALSVIGYALAAGLKYQRVIELANLAGGLEVEKLGVVPITRQELLAELHPGGQSTREKIVTCDELLPLLKRRRDAGQRIAMTNGCFDLLHPGHVGSLQAARLQGDCLVLGLNNDRSVRELKGAGRPIIDERGRAEMLAALACVDYVVLFDEASVAPLVERIRPDVLVKSAQYGTDEVVGHEIVESYGGKIVLAPMKSNYSTSDVIRRIQQAH